MTSVPQTENRSQGHLTPDAVKKLTEKLSEMMGEDIGKSFSQARNKKGELVNEEGLPIIDISEPVLGDDIRETGNALTVEEGQLPSIAAFPLSVKERWRQERDRILDQLEEEEQLARKGEEQAELEERKEIMRKRKDAAANEKESLKAAKEMQKKMGRALLRNMAGARAKDEDTEAVNDVSELEKPPSDSASKKTVAFADVPETSDDAHAKPSASSRSTQDWGDLAPARLRSTAGPSLLSSSDKLPMKMTVVERIPKPPPTVAMTRPTAAPDSDDESDPGSFSDTDDEPIDASESHERNSEDEDNPAVEEEEYDFDHARHQREIALQYYDKRNKIGEAARKAMTSHSHDNDGDVRVDPHLDMRTIEQDKPSISRFKAQHFASSYGAAIPSSSTSLGASVVPVSTAKTLQKAIRTGKLDADDRLVGGDADSASEDENENMQELLDLLKKGEVYNLGPDGKYIHAVPRPPSQTTVVPSAPESSTPSAKVPFSDLPPINRAKTSKFKLSRSPAERPPVAQYSPSPHSSPLSRSETGTPISNVQRSSPKMPSTPMTPAVVERPHHSSSTPPRSPLVNTSNQTTIDSPSFPQSISTPTSNSDPSVFSMVVESPSFPKPMNPQATLVNTRPALPPTVVSSAVRESAKGPDIRPQSSGTTSRLIRPPVIVSAAVLESSRRQTASLTPDHVEQAKPERISRFRAERM
ncbi:hypothetical protein Hypma_011892 [Hypsizygus marmoreus]|uniref:DUF3835 domain-containing protein n=1 Tax=Hypsizygus marmoreus TaxID=39966 RepID=A0A369JH18_HYPMA|nr:hypothetical protein Hypma_011892 [Hypsizygus marmoreus]